MKILFLPKYPRMGASSRLRTFQYLPLWQEAGHKLKVSPFFDQNYLEALYQKGKIRKSGLLRCFLRRWWWALRAPAYDLVILEKEIFPYFPAWMERYWKLLGLKYIVDYDDAVFHNYDRHPKPWVRQLLGRKIDKVMARSGMVWAGNPYLAIRAGRAGTATVRLLPTVVDIRQYRPVDIKEKTTVNVGWIGSPTTLRYLNSLLPVFEALQATHDFTLTIIANGKGIGFSGKEIKVKWTEETEIQALQQLDIGIMPLNNSPWEKGKCAYKLIQYMACGLPVVASPVGVNKDVVRHGENGFWANTHDEWIKALSGLIEDVSLRKTMGQKGRKLVEENYSLEKNWSRIQQWIGRK